MANNTIWASEASDRNKLAPSVEKVKQGWTAEKPPFEWFNWHMNRTDTRLNALEEPLENYVHRWDTVSRTETIKANARFDLPVSYIVGKNHLRVFLEGLICEPNEQYLECGQEGTESNYIRWLDDIPTEFTIRVEVPVRSMEPERNLDEEVLAGVQALASRVELLEQPVFCTMFDSQKFTRNNVINAGDVFVLPSKYTVGANQLQVFIDGVLQYEGTDYSELGRIGDESTDITFSTQIGVDKNIRIYISIRNGEKYTVLNDEKTLEAMHKYVQDHLYREERQDTTLETAIEALANFTVPEYTVGNNAIKIYRNGILLIPNRDYSENGIVGERSTKIIWNTSLPEGSLITAISPYFEA